MAFLPLPGHSNKGHPHTSYYQYSLGILALCVHRKQVHDSVVGKLLHAVEHDQPLPQSHLSVGEWVCPYPGLTLPNLTCLFTFLG